MRIAWPLLSLALTAVPLGAQTKVALPHAIGHLDPPAGWTALGPAELAAVSRDSDPRDEPARSLVAGIVAEIQRAERTNENVVLHGPGAATGQVRTINAYSAAVTAPVAELQSDQTIDQIRRALEEALATPGVEVVFLGSDKPEVFAIGCISLTFRLQINELTLHEQMYVVPAGERLAYFETQFMPEDIDAQLVIRNVLRTFDGAKEAPNNSTLEKMLLGGAAGAIAGIAVALLRRRRLQRARIGVDEPGNGNHNG